MVCLDMPVAYMSKIITCISAHLISSGVWKLQLPRGIYHQLLWDCLTKS